MLNYGEEKYEFVEHIYKSILLSSPLKKIVEVINLS